MKPFYWFTSFSFFLLMIASNLAATSAETNNRAISPQPSVEKQNLPRFRLLPVEFTVGGQPITSNVLVRGKEDLWKAVDFQNWLLPLETVMETLAFQVNTLDNGYWELQLPDRVTRINPNQLRVDPKLGLVLSVAEIENLLGIPVNFNSNLHSINFTPSWLAIRGNEITLKATPFEETNDYFASLTFIDGWSFYQPHENKIQENVVDLANSQHLNNRIINNQDVNINVNLLATSIEQLNKTNFRSNLNFKPLPNFSFNYNIDQNDNRSLHRLNFNWQAFPGLSLKFNGNHQNDNLTGGVSFAYNTDEFGTSTNLNLDGKNNLLWNITTNLGPLQFYFQDRLNYNNYQLTVNLDGEKKFNSGHQLVFNYENRQRRTYDHLTTFMWKYQSRVNQPEDKSWEFNLGYSIGTYGDGIVFSIARELFLGLVLRINYKEIGLHSNSPTFQFKLETR